MRQYPGSLHNHSDYSNLRIRDSINKIEDILSYANELGHKVIAFTEHEFTGNWIKIEKQIKKYPDLKIIRGNEIYLCRNGLNNDNYNRETDRYYHFILLAKDIIGAKQIMEISTRAWNRSYISRGMRRVPTYYQDLFDIIGSNPGHVIGSTACLGGALPTQILRGTNKDRLHTWIYQMDNLFGHGNFYLELQPSAANEQIKVNKKLLEFSKELDIPYIITTDSHYLKKEDRVIHKAYLNSQNGDREVDDFYATTYMMDTKELESYLSYMTDEQLEKAYTNIIKIGEMCEEFTLQKELKIPELMWRPVDYVSTEEKDFYIKKMPQLMNFLTSSHRSDKYLVDALIAGIKSHPDLQNDEAYAELDACLSDTWISSEVNNARWSAYFLNLQRTIDFCWEAGTIIGAGRGSGVGFLLLYALDIIQINCLREKTKTYRFRFLNPDRVSVLDIDTDISGTRRGQVLNYLRQQYGQDRIANVVTFGTEKSKSAILTAARGLGIDVDIAQYLASMIPADRGALRTLDEVFYGDEEKDFKPNKQFAYEMTQNYPELWNVARKIEGLVCRSGIHAGGIIFVDEPFTESTALMRAPDGTICTQFDLHDAESASLIKIDMLSVEGMDRIQTCLQLLVDNGLVEDKGSLRDNYENIIGVYNLERNSPEMWKMLCNHEVPALFQMEGQTGISGIESLQPSSVDDLAILNSTIRLMAQNKGDEMPTDKCARFKKSHQAWIDETEYFGLTEEHRKFLWDILGNSYGLCITQEQFMLLVQQPECGGFNLTWADKLRKSIAKKSPKDYEALTKEYYTTIKEKGCDEKLCRYVWDVLIAMSRGYGFNASHTLAYSIVALQELNLAYRFPILFWNCSCLITDSGGNELEENEEEDLDMTPLEEYHNELEDFTDEDNDDDITDAYDEEDCDGYPSEVVVMKDGKKKKKTKTTNFGKIATAIGRMASIGIVVSPPDINKSSYTFAPDLEHNMIMYGLSGITRIGEDLIQNIIENRPYNSLEEFMEKVKVNKLQMINLIKSGAFDQFGINREDVMNKYVDLIADKKKRITLQNMKMLIDYKLLPESLDFECKVFNFNKYLKKLKYELFYLLDENALRFYEANYDMDKLYPCDINNCQFKINQNVWDNIYKKAMDPVRVYIKNNAEELLEKLNQRQVENVVGKYCDGTISKWEMDSVSYYSHKHELEDIDLSEYGVSDYASIPDIPMIDKIIPIKGKRIPLYKIYRIAGTVIDKNKMKKTITLLTTSGVVTVRIFGDVFSYYDKQLSVKGADGKKHVTRKSEFSRGNKIIVCGIKQDNMFSAKKYKGTPYHLIETIELDNDEILFYNRSDEE